MLYHQESSNSILLQNKQAQVYAFIIKQLHVLITYVHITATKQIYLRFVKSICCALINNNQSEHFPIY